MRRAHKEGRLPEGVIREDPDHPKRRLVVRKSYVDELSERDYGRGKPLYEKEPMVEERTEIVDGKKRKSRYWTVRKIVEESKGKLGYSTVADAIDDGRLWEGVARDISGNRERLVRESIAKRLVRRAKGGEKVIPKREEAGIFMFDEINGGRRKQTPFWSLDRIKRLSDGKVSPNTLRGAINDGRLWEGVVRTNDGVRRRLIREDVAKKIITRAGRGELVVPKSVDGVVMLPVRTNGQVVKKPFWSVAHIQRMSGGRLKTARVVKAIIEGRIPKKYAKRDPKHSRRRHLVDAEYAGQLANRARVYTVPIRRVAEVLRINSSSVDGQVDKRAILGRQYTTQRDLERVIKTKRETPLRERLAEIEKGMEAIRGEHRELWERDLSPEGRAQLAEKLTARQVGLAEERAGLWQELGESPKEKAEI